MRLARIHLPYQGTADARRALYILDTVNRIQGTPPDLFVSGVRYQPEVPRQGPGPAYIHLVLPLDTARDGRVLGRSLVICERALGYVPVVTGEGGRGEDWLSWRVLWDRGVGDCEDLASALSARVRGRSFLRRSGPRLLHALTRHPRGMVLDPSAALGMYDGR